MIRRSRTHDAPLSLFSFQDIMACLTGVLILVVLMIALDGLSSEMRLEAAHSEPAGAAATAEEIAAQQEDVRREVADLEREIAARQGGAVVGEAEVRIMEERRAAAERQAEALAARVTAMAREEAELDARLRAVAAERSVLDARRVAAELATRRERVRFRPGQEDGRRPVFVEVAAGGVRLGELDPSRAPVLARALPPVATDDDVLRALGATPASGHYAVFVVHADSIARFEVLRHGAFRLGYEVGWQIWDGEAGAFLEPRPSADGALPRESAP